MSYTHTWITGDNGNRASVGRWGSEEAARASLATLKDCSGCSDCSDCSDCSGCSGKKDVSEVGKQPLVPTIEAIHSKVFAAASAPDALDMGTWHNSCGTTHCRAGWVVHLAGEAGYKLEKFFNTELAAMLIYRESSPALKVSPVRLYENSDTALADMKRMAELEAAAVQS